ncbi:hypothetical protein E8E11_001832 [Didymella keratinophila]|nr:hypothetical protein E8E11_001832 [Didymella keratinophila]
MSAPIDFTWKIDYERSQREDPAHAARVADEFMFVRIDWKLKLKKTLWPWSRDKRLAKEAALTTAVAEEPVQRAEEPVEPASLLSAGLQKLKKQEDEPLPPSPVEETDPNMTRGDCDDHISALPPMPGHQRQVSAVSSEDTRTSIHQQSDEEPSLEGLMDDVLDAADAPGNRCSVRSPLPQEWRDAEFSRTRSSSGLTQPEVSKSTEYLPLPSAVFTAGPGHLPSLSASRSVPNFAVTSSRPGLARVDG